MKIINKKLNNIASSSPKKDVSKNTKEEFILHGEFDSMRASMKLLKNKKGFYDAQQTYFINRDGSGRLLTAWDSQDYPEGTFTSIMEHAKDILKTNSTRRFSEDDVKTLIDEAENIIKGKK